MADGHGWELVVLFGSTARAGTGRDVDIAVQPGNHVDLMTQGGWQQALESITAPTPVDLVLITDGLPPLMRFEVFRSGECLFERRPGQFERERDRAFFLYADSEWLRRSASGTLNRIALERKLAHLRLLSTDLGRYAAIDTAARRREHYAIERLLQLLCETAADIGLQLLKSHPRQVLAGSYREVFELLEEYGELPKAMSTRLVSACGMRNVLTHLYDTIDLDRVIAAVDPAVHLYRDYLGWVLGQLDR